MLDKYILKGKKAILAKDIEEWTVWYETADRTVVQTTLPDGKLVSTVFLGINHNFFRMEKPLVFETMVFKNKGNFYDLDCERYSTWEEAEEGHKKMVEKWKETK